MKKLLCLSILISICLLTGCTSQSFSNYEKEMKKVRDANTSYTMEVKESFNDKNINYKYFKNSEKWKTEEHLSRKLISTQFYNGYEYLTYNKGLSSFAINDSKSVEILRKISVDETAMAVAMYISQPSSRLFYWNYTEAGKIANPKFGNKKEIKNGFECRMIEYGDSEEVCISDKYGVAAYRKIKDSVGYTTYNLLKIDTSDIPEDEFDLPSNIKIKELQ